jgi:hypothetical protein
MIDMIDRQAAIDALAEDMPQPYTHDGSHPADEGIFMAQEIYADCIQTLKDLPSAQPEEVIPHRNYKYLSDYWCECGWHLGKKGDVKYCAECGRKVNWNG